jgi:hypothetical protein
MRTGKVGNEKRQRGTKEEKRRKNFEIKLET